MFWNSSAIRITLTIMAAFTLLSALVVGLVFWRTNDMLARQNMSSLLAEARVLSEIAARDGTPALLRRLRERYAASDSMLFGLADASGQAVWLGGLKAWPAALERDNQSAVFDFQPAPDPSRRQIRPSGDLVAFGATVRLPDGERLLVGRDVTEQNAFGRTLRIWFVTAVCLLALLALVAGWIINRMLLRRLEAMTGTAGRIMAGDLSQRVALSDADDEFDDLARHLNRMLERIEALMNGLREVSDNIAHDLKTPLNRLRIRAEQALRDPRGDAACREGLEATLVEADELMRTFNALLRVARLEAGTLGENAEVVDLAELARSLAEFYEPVVEEAGAKLLVDVPDQLHVRASRQLMTQAVTNLIENAVKYGLPDVGRHFDITKPQISIGVRRDGGRAVVWVADRGEGIAEEDRNRVLKRFVRLDAARSKPGTGLGLSLVAAVMRQHGGGIELCDNQPGLRIELHLPAERIVDDARASDATGSLGATRGDCHASMETHSKTSTAEVR